MVILFLKVFINIKNEPQENSLSVVSQCTTHYDSMLNWEN